MKTLKLVLHFLFIAFVPFVLTGILLKYAITPKFWKEQFAKVRNQKDTHK
jgi:uncharacterized protein YjeT (DUF2065 family)